MSTSTQSVVERFMTTFERNLADVADLMTPEALWELNGEAQTQTAAAFVERQQADLATGTASTDVECWIIDGQQAAWIGWTTFTPHHDGEPMRIAMSEWFTITDGRISRIHDIMAMPG
ncbi:nuclear transport factor 2 family protein [Phycicoccus sp. BSK3Z-2]|uniref:Nuclear transport factor 2 family protein n=1 Tax=Phycicoccus avicenniae TaxID=2828860 RepID=A0A941DAJ7_9MICO|nr:nuclear transport factor 2 family protein [Phycicoccus avicenniae]MBR7742872.1 nuclear transport factor 2 family protein [Phycicoccus avicenniae]